ncbi:hypothetical protein Syun_021763 [Stephania yunnanensis]|uniref:Uncharacterized protein n=1 Tax=Stephania yunnanensis TaxID=152371 RepID=A0AAP0IG82_9MAGN
MISYVYTMLCGLSRDRKYLDGDRGLDQEEVEAKVAGMEGIVAIVVATTSKTNATREAEVDGLLIIL